jgi:methylmalonyl-CoA/ethylmalonyl-CoA epimerase
MILQRIDHVGYAVEDLEEAVRYHERLYGAEVVHRETMESAGVREALIAVDDRSDQRIAPHQVDVVINEHQIAGF